MLGTSRTAPSPRKRCGVRLTQVRRALDGRSTEERLVGVALNRDGNRCEAVAGVREGGRTGLTAVVIGVYFTSSIFLAPLFGAVPDLATAPVLVLVGVMMMPEAAKIQWSNMNDALPAFLTIILMPLTYSITNGMVFGLLTSIGFYFTTGQFWTDAQTIPSCKVEATTETENLVPANRKAETVEYGTV